MKQIITRLNYEAFLVDFYEGNLDPLTKNQVELFLIENPDIKDEFDAFSESLFIDENVVFEEKELLKKSVIDFISPEYQNIDEFLVAGVENELSLVETIKFKKLLLTNPEIAQEYKLYEKTVLQPDLKITFTDKNTLKRSFIPVLSVQMLKRVTYYSAAAILLITLLFVNRDLFRTNNPPEIAQLPVLQNQQSEVLVPEEDQTNKLMAINSNTKLTENELHNNSEITLSVVKPEIEKNSPDSSIDLSTLQNQEIIAFQPKTELNIGKYAYEIENISHGGSYTIDQYLLRQFRKKMLNESREEYNSRKFSGWDLVDLGIRQTGKLFGQEWQLKKDYDNEGNIENLAFNSRMLSFDYPVRK